MGRDGEEYMPICHFGKPEYFCARGLTVSGAICPPGGFVEMVAQIGRLRPAGCRQNEKMPGDRSPGISMA
jgi:hypothetical protein